MMKVSMLKKEFKQYLKDNHINFTDLNKIHKDISIPMYMLNLKVTDDENNGIIMEIVVMVTIFTVGEFMYFDAFNIYRSNKRNLVKTLKIINTMNQSALPGRFIIDDENCVGYRCIFSYKNIDNLANSDLGDIIDSIPPACYLFMEQLEGGNDEQ